jgi:serpin B
VEPATVKVRMPKFKFVSRFELGHALTEMGMPLAFSEKADFSGMSTTAGFRISNVIHQAYIDVNEEGTEAAAATAVDDTRGGAMFVADRPFLFVIRDNRTGAILFLGRVVDPTAKE